MSFATGNEILFEALKKDEASLFADANLTVFSRVISSIDFSDPLPSYKRAILSQLPDTSKLTKLSIYYGPGIVSHITFEILSESSIAVNIPVDYVRNEMRFIFTYTDLSLTAFTDPPTGASPQIFCASSPVSARVNQLVVEGSEIKWYASPSGGLPLNTETNLENETTYYASQTIFNSESIIRLPVVAILDTPAPPVGPAIQYFRYKDEPRVSDLIPQTDENIGIAINWYFTPDNPYPFMPQNPLSDNQIYYGKITNALGCQSAASLEVHTVVYSMPYAFLVDGLAIAIVGDSSALLAIERTQNDPTSYTILYSEDAKSAGFIDVINQPMPENNFTIVIPPDITPGDYNATFTVSNGFDGNGDTSWDDYFTVRIIPA